MAPQVLIVSASTGTGHVRAAEALTEAFAEVGAPGGTVENVDLLTLAPRWVRAAYGSGYEWIATRTPRVWRQLYHRTDTPSPDLARWGPVMHRILFREFRRLLLSGPWRAVVCTHFLPGQLAAGTPGAPPFVMVITDLTLHHFWVQPRVDRYFVASDRLAGELRSRLAGARVDATGIPIASRFARPPDRCAARAELGLGSAAPTALVMGGGMGIGVDELAEEVATASVDGLQVLAICGRNEAARARLEQTRSVANPLHVRGYVSDVERYVAASDVVVTKPGGLTTSEVLALGRPLILTHAIPGQEDGNRRVLCAGGAAIEASVPGALRRQVERLFNEPGVLESHSAAAANLGRPHAAQRIAELVQNEVMLEVAA